MNQDVLKQKVQDILAKRNMAYVTTLGFMAVSILLCIMLMTKEDKTILIPQNNLEKEYVFQGEKISDSYLIEWASGLLSRLMTVNPHTVSKQVNDFLRVTASPDGLVKQLNKQAKIIKHDKISTVFYPKEFAVNSKEKVVEVKGDFLAYIGSDKNPVVQEKTYLLGYRRMANGLVAVESLKEVEDEK